ncbi:MAG: hypothetical protein OEM93_24310 [Rhodospirillales bacterium]|nr:hypothetical protein [Rhodospirillales bacterium]
MHGHRTASSLTLALLTATFLTPPERALAAPGDALGREFQVNSFTASHQRASSIAMDADGDFIVAWHSTGQDGNSWGVFARRYNAAGRPEGGVFQVNQETASHQTYPSVAVDADGDFVVAWGSNGQDGSGYGIYARRYDAAGVAQGPEFQVNTFVTGSQSRPAVAMDAEGDFVVAWQSNGQDGDSWGVYAPALRRRGRGPGRRDPGQQPHDQPTDLSGRGHGRRRRLRRGVAEQRPGRQLLRRLRPAL